MLLKQYKKKFLAYLNRDNINHMEGQVDPVQYHSMFFFSATSYNLLDNKKSLWMYILPICTTISASTAVLTFLISILHYIQKMDIHLITESGTYLLIMLYKLFIRISVNKGKPYYQTLVRALQDDFNYISTKGQKYRETFFENQKLTFQACVLVALFLSSIGGGMAICACIAAVVTLCIGSKGITRPLPYPIWFFDYDLHVSPAYEITFISSMLFTMFHTLQYIFMVQSQLVWIREVTCRADLLNWNLQDMLVNVSPARTKEEADQYAAFIKHRMREIISMHQSMYDLLHDYATVFKKCLLYEQLLAAPIICTTAYSFAEKLDQGEFKLILLLLCISIIWVAFVPCYLCTHLLEKVQSVGDACWNIPFWNAGPVIRPYLVLIMQRSLRPLPIVAAGFQDISLQTYSRMMTRSYSCFNMLRQADFNF